MKDKLTIDPRYYGVNGYGNVPSYDIPYRATGHLVYYPKGKTLCGAPWGSLHPRKVEASAWSKVCKECQKVATRDGIPEWALPPLRKGDCPVLSERTGERRKHIWVARRPRCKNCPPAEKYRTTERCERKHETYAYCNACGLEDKTRHYCDTMVWHQFTHGYCDRKAGDEPVLVPNRRNSSFGTYPDHWQYVCFQHHPDAVQARKDAFAAKMQAHEDRYAADRKKRHDADDAFDILVDVARWVVKNRDLAEEDEWLGEIAKRLADNDAVQQALGED